MNRIYSYKFVQYLLILNHKIQRGFGSVFSKDHREISDHESSYVLNFGYNEIISSLNQSAFDQLRHEAITSNKDIIDSYMKHYFDLLGSGWTRVYYGRNCNCLLYTSPSPRDRTRSRMPSSA